MALLGLYSCRDDEARLPGLQHIGGEFAVAGLEAGIGNRLEAEGFPPVMHGVPGIAHIKVDVVDGLDLQEVGFLGHGT